MNECMHGNARGKTFIHNASTRTASAPEHFSAASVYRCSNCCYSSCSALPRYRCYYSRAEGHTPPTAGPCWQISVTILNVFPPLNPFGPLAPLKRWVIEPFRSTTCDSRLHNPYLSL